MALILENKKLENPQMTGLRSGIALLIMAIIILLCGIELKNN